LLVVGVRGPGSHASRPGPAGRIRHPAGETGSGPAGPTECGPRRQPWEKQTSRARLQPRLGRQDGFSAAPMALVAYHLHSTQGYHPGPHYAAPAGAKGRVAETSLAQGPRFGSLRRIHPDRKRRDVCATRGLLGLWILQGKSPSPKSGGSALTPPQPAPSSLVLKSHLAHGDFLAPPQP